MNDKLKRLLEEDEKRVRSKLDFTYMKKIASKELFDDLCGDDPHGPTQITSPVVIVCIYVDEDRWWERLECQEPGDVPFFVDILGQSKFLGDSWNNLYPARVLVR